MEVREAQPSQSKVTITLVSLQVLLHPIAGYMVRQDKINVKMRSILVDWLVQVHSKFVLQPETLFLTISIMDRFLSVRASHYIIKLNKPY